MIKIITDLKTDLDDKSTDDDALHCLVMWKWSLVQLSPLLIHCYFLFKKYEKTCEVKKSLIFWLWTEKSFSESRPLQIYCDFSHQNFVRLEKSSDVNDIYKTFSLVYYFFRSI